MNLENILKDCVKRIACGQERFLLLYKKDDRNIVPLPQEHVHNYLEFCMVLEGQARIFHYGEIFTAIQGTTLFFPAGSSHCEFPSHNSQHYKLLWAILSPTHFRLLISKYTGGDNYTIDKGIDLFHSTPLLQGLNSELQSACQIKDQTMRNCLFQAILVLLFTQGIHRLQSQTTDSKQWSIRVAMNIEKYIETNIMKPLVLKEIADNVHLSPCYLSSFYTKLRGHTLFDYLNRRRIYRACEILTNPKLNISEVAYQAGFDDPLYFSKVFKKIKGCTPTAYRKSLS